MPRLSIVRSSKVHRSPRVKQVEGLFDVAPTEKSELSWEVNLPVEDRDWNIGLIVGPSGCGKSTIAKEAFGECLVHGFEWSPNAVVDDFPKEMAIKEITALLSSVGFSSPPSWLRPFHALSNGEQFRVTLARAMAESGKNVFAVDEFTSVVDRTVAEIGSAAVAKTVRKSGRKFVAISCHYDIVEWLQPDWIYEPATNHFQWRSLRRHPAVELEIVRCHSSAWQLFKGHHYLDTKIHKGAGCFVGLVRGEPAVFAAVCAFPHPSQPAWRGHRTVCLPDYQGVGLGNVLSEYVASLYAATGKRYSSTTSSPSMIHHRARSPLWKMRRAPSHVATRHAGLSHSPKSSGRRLTAGFDYVGPVNREDAIAFGVLKTHT